MGSGRLLSDDVYMSAVKNASMVGLAVGAVAVVFGDIGTSPLYAFKQTLLVSGTDKASVLGIISLIFWSLLLVVSFKYVSFVMRADNNGEGGVLALFAKLPGQVRSARKGWKFILLAFVLAGTALLFGDGALTPAISVLSATEGLSVVNPDLAGWAVPLTVIILAVLFSVQFKGTGAIGRVFGPVMVAWFIVIAGLGLWRALQFPEVFQALLPKFAVAYLVHNPGLALVVGSFVILAVTGAEALYADMGHFGVRPIRMAWFVFVWPALILCYMGQGSMVLQDSKNVQDPFFALSPNPVVTVFLVVLATVATVIASQALITGVYSLTRQGIQLGLFPRLGVKHTSKTVEGQIYVPVANWLLGFAAITLVIVIGSSERLAAAYMFAISGTMLVTTVAFFIVMRADWGWSYWKAIPLTVTFAIVDLFFFIATAGKIVEGGWVPVVIAALVLYVMLLWRRGQRILKEHSESGSATWTEVERMLTSGDVDRVPGEGVILASHTGMVPQALGTMIKLVKNVPERLIVLTLVTLPVPEVGDDADRIVVKDMGFGVLEMLVSVGFAETPNVPELISRVDGLDEESRVYYLSDRTFLATNAGQMGVFNESVFAFLHRNATRPAQYFRLPDDRVVTLSTHVDL